MAHSVQGVVARGKGQPVELTTILVPDPGPGEALVQVQACGVCHTDLHYREGAINDEFPFLLGHEAAGIVESVGAGVEDVEPGDYVILAWRAPCGTCRSCVRGKPWYCFESKNAAQPMTLDGQPLSNALGIGAFAEKTLVHAKQCVKVDPAAPPEAAGGGHIRLTERKRVGNDLDRGDAHGPSIAPGRAQPQASLTAAFAFRRSTLSPLTLRRPRSAVSFSLRRLFWEVA